MLAKFDLSTSPNDLADAAKHMLDLFLERAKNVPGMKNAYRLEFTLDSFEDSKNPKFVLRLRYDPLVWFHRVIASDTSLTRDYIDGVKKVAKSKPDWLHQLHPQDGAEPLEFLERCKYGTGCRHKMRCEKDHRDEIECKASVPRKDGSSGKCGSIGDPLLKLAELSTSSYYVLARRESTRDMLIVPARHLTNKSMAADPAFWTFLLKTIGALKGNLQTTRLPVVGVALNFGHWETRTSVDRFALDCHAHAHIIVTPEAIELCTETCLPQMKGRRYDPEQYELVDAKALELTILPLELESMRKDVGDMKRDMESVKTDIKTILRILQAPKRD